CLRRKISWLKPDDRSGSPVEPTNDAAAAKFRRVEELPLRGRPARARAHGTRGNRAAAQWRTWRPALLLVQPVRRGLHLGRRALACLRRDAERSADATVPRDPSAPRPG